MHSRSADPTGPQEPMHMSYNGSAWCSYSAGIWSKVQGNIVAITISLLVPRQESIVFYQYLLISLHCTSEPSHPRLHSLSFFPLNVYKECMKVYDLGQNGKAMNSCCCVALRGREVLLQK